MAKPWGKNLHAIDLNHILNSQVVSLSLQSIANFCAAMDTLIDQDVRTNARQSYSRTEFC